MTTRSAPRFTRRTVLRSAGTAVALPFLTSLAAPARAAAQPVRMLFFYVPNGMNMGGWASKGTGATYQPGPTLAPLMSLREDVLVVSGLDNKPASFDSNGDHTNGTAAFLTCRRPVKSGLRLGISVDQVAARQIGKAALPSLQLGVGSPSSDHCDGYPCPYGNNISWADATTPLPKLKDAGAVFDRLFQGSDPAANTRDRARRKLYRTSVLDFAVEDIERLGAAAAAADKAKLDEYLTGIRELEARIAAMEEGADSACAAGERPPARGAGLAESVKTMLDLSVLAFQCDRTRVISFMMHAAQSDPSYDFLGVRGGHHSISHHGGNPSNLAKLLVIDKWEVEQLAYLLGKMKAIDEGGRSLLHNSLVFFASDLSDGDRHRHNDLPVVLAGHGGGAVTPGRHLRAPGGTPIANLFLAMLHAAKVTASSFGDSTGALPL